MRLDDHLAGEYQNLLRRAHSLAIKLREKLGAPLVLGISEGFEESKYRLLYVGQESFGWGFNEQESSATGDRWRCDLASAMRDQLAVDELFNSYNEFDFSEYPESRRNRRAPFWRAHISLLNCLGEKSYRSGAWSNIIRCDASPSGTASVLRALSQVEMHALLGWQANLLCREIERLEPRAIVFVTGPSYDFALNYLFPEINFDPMRNEFGFSVRQFARVRHESLPICSFRLYHPAYLSRIGALGIIDRLAEVIRREAAPP